MQLARQLGIEMPKCSLFFLPHWVAVILTTHRHCHTRPRRIETGELSTFVFRLHTVAWATNLTQASQKETPKVTFFDFFACPSAIPSSIPRILQRKGNLLPKSSSLGRGNGFGFWAWDPTFTNRMMNFEIRFDVEFPANHESLILGTPKPT